MTSDDINAILDEADIFEDDGSVKEEFHDDLDVLFDAFAKLSRDERSLTAKKNNVKAKILSQWLGKDGPAVTKFGKVTYKSGSPAKESPDKDAALKMLVTAVNFDKALQAFVTLGFDKDQAAVLLKSAQGEFDIPQKQGRSTPATLTFKED